MILAWRRTEFLCGFEEIDIAIKRLKRIWD